MLLWTPPQATWKWKLGFYMERSACDCPAGLSVFGLGKCNHVAAVLFAVEDFHQKGLAALPQPISCTSRLSQWVVPRTSKVDPKPLTSIV